MSCFYHKIRWTVSTSARYGRLLTFRAGFDSQTRFNLKAVGLASLLSLLSVHTSYEHRRLPRPLIWVSQDCISGAKLNCLVDGAPLHDSVQYAQLVCEDSDSCLLVSCRSTPGLRRLAWRSSLQ